VSEQIAETAVSEPIMWWGYLHANGTPQIKRWWGDPRDYTDDCVGNEFVQCVVEPFEAASREDAERILHERLGLAVVESADALAEAIE
jgi:hypothetical protein